MVKSPNALTFNVNKYSGQFAFAAFANETLSICAIEGLSLLRKSLINTILNYDVIIFYQLMSLPVRCSK